VEVQITPLTQICCTVFQSLCVWPVVCVFCHVLHSSSAITNASAARPGMSYSECSFTPVLFMTWASSLAKMSLMKHLKVCWICFDLVLHSQTFDYSVPSDSRFGWFHGYIFFYFVLRRIRVTPTIQFTDNTMQMQKWKIGTRHSFFLVFPVTLSVGSCFFLHFFQFYFC